MTGLPFAPAWATSGVTMDTTCLVAALAAFWLGGLIALDLIEAPAKFRIQGLDRNTAVELGRAVFARFNLLEVVVALLILAATLSSPGAGRLWWASGALLLLALVASLGLRPQMRRLGQKLDLVNRDPARAQEYRAIRGYHRAYVLGEFLKMAVLVTLILQVTFRAG